MTARSERGIGWGEDWQRLHPLSPVLRGGIVAIAIVGYLLSQAFDRLFSAVGGSFWNGPADSGTDVPGGPGAGGDLGLTDVVAHPLLAVGGALAVIAVVLGGAWLSWRFSVFRVTPSQVELRSGWLFRQHRQVPLERVQAVDVSRPLLAQMLGLAQVVVQSAGGRDAQLKLAFLRLDRAEAVRDHLLELAARSDEQHRGVPALTEAEAAPDVRAAPDGWAAPDGRAGGEVGAGGQAGAGGEARAGVEVPGGAGRGGPAWEDPGASLRAMVTGGPDAGRPVLSVPNGRLLVATLLHGSTVILVLMLLVAAGVAAGIAGNRSVLVAFIGSVPAIGPVLLGVAVSRVRELLKHGNFRLSDLGPSLRLRHGLTDQRTTTVPLHRVQAMEMVQPLWWRPLGWWRARVNVAGVHGSDDDPTSETVVLPVGTLDQALGVLTLLDPRLSLDVLSRAALGDGPEGGWTLVSPRARPLDLLAWRRTGYAVTGEAILLRRGRLTRSVVAVPHARIQSVTLTQGPLERRLGLAAVRLVSTPGPVGPLIEHLAVPEAHRLLAEESERARAARIRVPVRLHESRDT
ncbi:MAG TPA: PH domain-containing protein [Dermatophilaceae bacterium]|nr:PH domain-containing protein [Dermatophilaceae bacterium]